MCNHPDLLESAYDDTCKYRAIEWIYLFQDLLFLSKLCFSVWTACYPPLNEIVEQCGKFHLLDRLVERLFARNHKVCFRVLCLHFPITLLLSVYLHAAAFANCYQVLIFSQWTKVLDIMDYYFSEKGFEVCRIDGSVKLDERKRQVCTNARITQHNIIIQFTFLIFFFIFFLYCILF